MNLEQLKHLINLNQKDQKRLLEKILVEKMRLLKKALNLEDQEWELELLADKIGELNTRIDSPEIAEVSRFLVLVADLVELNEAEERIDDFIWQAEQSKKIIQQLINQAINKIQKFTKEAKK